MFNVIILITIIILFVSFFKYRYILFCLGDNWEFAKPFESTAFFINISSLTEIILVKKFLLGYLLNVLFYMDYYRFREFWLKILAVLHYWLEVYAFILALPRGVRQFFARRAVNYLLKKFSQVAQKRNEGHKMQQHSPTYEVKVFLHMDLLYELIKYVNSCLWHFECRKYQWYDPCHCWPQSLHMPFQC